MPENTLFEKVDELGFLVHVYQKSLQRLRKASGREARMQHAANARWKKRFKTFIPRYRKLEKSNKELEQQVQNLCKLITEDCYHFHGCFAGKNYEYTCTCGFKLAKAKALELLK